jgi:hypothetical protein
MQSKEFYGGIGATIDENFAVFEMEKDQTSFFVSTAPTTRKRPVDPINQDYLQLLALYYPEEYSKYMAQANPTMTPEELIKALKNAGRDSEKVAQLMGNNPAHVIGMDTKNSFNGTWGTDATWHKIFYKDIKAHEMFSGVFEAEKLIKFHENPVPEKEKVPCDGIDC